MKEAQTEAEKDISKLKERKEQELEEYKKKFEGTQSSVQDKIDRETKEQLKEIENAFSKKNAELIKKLLERVGQVDPKAHRNLHKIEA